MLISEYKKNLENNFILLLTSNSKEKLAINKILKNTIRVSLSEKNNGAYLGMIGNVFVLHLSGESGTISNRSISNVCKSFISNSIYPKPAIIILSGICWGDPHKTKIGNTIISDEIFTANQQNVTADGYNPRIRTNKSCITIHDNIFSDNENLISGPICSAELLITDERHRDRLLGFVPTCFGGEMEGFALIPALKDINWLMIKTVSDYADSSTYSREDQLDFCDRLASDITYIIPKLILSLDLSFNMESEDALLVYDIISGNSIEFNISHFDIMEMNSFLNDSYGTMLLRKLRNYIDGEIFNEDFIYEMTDIVLELVQNEFKHNNARKVVVKFENKAIQIESENKLFDISLIKGDNGGALAWRSLFDRYIKEGDIEYFYSNNRITFKLRRFLDKINAIKSKCKISLNTSKSGFSKYRPLLEFNDTCDSVYYNMKNDLMTSRALGIFEQIEKIVAQGKTVYLCVRDDYQKEKYIKLMKDNHEKVKFIN
ncbi:5'-methylthioadenosine/S-adenosylhomocysteine nucleosidase [Enterobacter asburiae]|uniref:hypothetical protein n=1 Tax=Enterobacter asburiae TaxID=61645 RepID=UPI003B2627A8